ncbi:MAG: hypothetical protein MZU91_04995 [Desulfosudis oleivorans]|nr:hypothetical protein [Desulfosudis oleivorans]
MPSFLLLGHQGEAELADCPHLTDEERELISGDLTRSDWREELIVKTEGGGAEDSTSPPLPKGWAHGSPMPDSSSLPWAGCSPSRRKER